MLPIYNDRLEPAQPPSGSFAYKLVHDMQGAHDTNEHKQNNEDRSNIDAVTVAVSGRSTTRCHASEGSTETKVVQVDGSQEGGTNEKVDEGEYTDQGETDRD